MAENGSQDREGAEDRCRMCSMFLFMLKVIVVFNLVMMLLFAGRGDAPENKGSDDIDW